MTDFLYKDQGAACGVDGRCFVRNDDPVNAFTGSLSLSVLHLASGATSPVGAAFPVSLAPGAASMTWTCAGGSGDPYSNGCPQLLDTTAAAGCNATGSDCVLLVSVADGSGAEVLSSWELLTIPASMSIDASAVITATAADALQPSPQGPVATVTVTSDKTAVLVWLSTLAQGRFSDNAFHVPAGKTVTVDFIFFGPPDVSALQSSLRVEAANTYANGF